MPNASLTIGSTVFGGSSSHEFSELFGEVALVAEAGLLGDLGDASAGGGNSPTSSVDTDAENELLGREAEELFEAAVELADGEVGHASEIGDVDALVVGLKDVVDDVLHLPVGLEDVAGLGIVAHDAGDANDLPCRVEEGSLAGQVPSQGAVAIGNEPGLVGDGNPFAHDAAVFGDILLGEIGGEKVIIGFADDILFSVDGYIAEEGAVDGDEAALCVFAVEIDFRQVVEEPGHIDGPVEPGEERLLKRLCIHDAQIIPRSAHFLQDPSLRGAYSE